MSGERTVVIAMDGSENADNAFECEYELSFLNIMSPFSNEYYLLINIYKNKKKTAGL